jgi:hypothetical protein
VKYKKAEAMIIPKISERTILIVEFPGYQIVDENGTLRILAKSEI